MNDREFEDAPPRPARDEAPKEAPHKAQGPKERFRVRSNAAKAPCQNLEVDATDEENARAQWHATNGPGYESAELRVDRVEARVSAPAVRAGILGRR